MITKALSPCLPSAPAASSSPRKNVPLSSSSAEQSTILARVGKMLGYALTGLYAVGVLGDLLSSPPNYWTIAANLGAVGIVAWLVWYQNSRYIPSLLRSHEETLQQMTASHSNALKNVVMAFKDEMKAEREQCAKYHDEEQRNYRDLTSQLNRQHDEVIRGLSRREANDE